MEPFDTLARPVIPFGAERRWSVVGWAAAKPTPLQQSSCLRHLPCRSADRAPRTRHTVRRILYIAAKALPTSSSPSAGPTVTELQHGDYSSCWLRRCASRGKPVSGRPRLGQLPSASVTTGPATKAPRRRGGETRSGDHTGGLRRGGLRSSSVAVGEAIWVTKRVPRRSQRLSRISRTNGTRNEPRRPTLTTAAIERIRVRSIHLSR